MVLHEQKYDYHILAVYEVEDPCQVLYVPLIWPPRFSLSWQELLIPSVAYPKCCLSKVLPTVPTHFTAEAASLMALDIPSVRVVTSF